MNMPRLRRMRLVSGFLSLRFAALLGIALLPVGTISVLQTRVVQIQSQQRSEAALAGATLRAAMPMLSRIDEGRATAAALALAVGAMRGAEGAGPGVQHGDACARLLADAAGKLSRDDYSYAAFIDADGMVRCASDGVMRDLSGVEGFRARLDDPRPFMNVRMDAAISGHPVLLFSHPLRDATGAATGFISLSLPLAGIEAASLARPDPDKAATLILFNDEGRVLAASVPPDAVERHLPRDRALGAFQGLREAEARTFTDLSRAGGTRVYSVVGVEPGALSLLGSWPADHSAEASRFARLPPELFPGLMLLIGMVVAIAGTEWLVTRHVRLLRGSIRAFAEGDRRPVALDVSHAPLEIRQVAASFERMTESILRDEAELENVIHQKEVLLREVHHRVKNNLQLIASILNLQMRQAVTPEARALMKGVQDRVMSLATIHRGLYQTSGLTDITASELLSDLARQVVGLGTGGGRSVTLESNLDPVRLTPDQAVPLALLTTEALTNALKYAGTPAGGGAAWLRLGLRHDAVAGTATLEIVNSTGGGAAEEGMAPLPGVAAGTGLGGQLLAAFSQQLDAAHEIEAGADRYSLRVTFPVAPLDSAEARRSGDGADPRAVEDEGTGPPDG